MNIQNAMVSNVSTCHRDSPLEEVALMMWNNDCGSIPIIDDEHKPIGMITDRDIAMGSALKHKSLWELKASDIAQDRPVYSCQESNDIHSAVELMQEYKVRRLPVTNENGELTGIVSMGDIVACTNNKKSSELSINSTSGMLKAVSGHHKA